MTKVGVVGLPGLASALTSAGLDVVFEPDVAESVRAINAEMRTGQRFGVILSHEPRLESLASKMQASGVSLVMVHLESDPNPSADYPSVKAPCDVSDIMSHIGVSEPLKLTLSDDGSVSKKKSTFDDFDWGAPPPPPVVESPPSGEPKPRFEPEPPPPPPGYEPEPEPEPVQQSRPEPSAPRPEPTPEPEPVVLPRRQAPTEPLPPVERKPPQEHVFEKIDDDDPFMSSLSSEPTVGLDEAARLKQGAIVFVIGSKGGIGKSTMSVALADRAAKRGRKVILVDGNYGQGDLSIMLKISGYRTSTIHDFALSGNLHSTLISPVDLNKARNSREEVKFSFVRAPSESEARSREVSPETYRELLSHAAMLADLVVVDTQIVETDDPRGMVSRMVIPELQAGAYAVALSDFSAAGLRNLILRVKDFTQNHRIKAEHILGVLNRVPLDEENKATIFAENLGKLAYFIGTIWHDADVPRWSNASRPVSDLPSFTFILDRILNRATGMPVDSEPFDPERKPGFFSRLFGRKKK